MADLFLSYSHKDRERVKPIQGALAAQGFDVFWDQTLPVDVDWDTWIRRHLGEAKCAIAIWSLHSVASDNVRHEAMVAKQQGKLLAVLLEPLGADQFPMGLYSAQAANLTSWEGDERDPEWVKFREAVEARLMAPWVRKLLDGLDAELVAERARREAAERRNKTLREQIAKEAELQQELAGERDHALEDAQATKLRLEGTIASLKERIARLETESAASISTTKADVLEKNNKIELERGSRTAEQLTTSPTDTTTAKIWKAIFIAVVAGTCAVILSALIHR